MINIFIEGKEDYFLRQAIIKAGKQEYLQEIDFVNTKGYTELSKNENKFKDNEIKGIKNLIIYDADHESNNGGWKKRQNEIKKIIDEWDVNYQIFLFPNNKDDGDFEDLLLTCINSNHGFLIDCFDGYCSCVKGNISSDGIQFVTPNNKAKLYSYITSFPTSNRRKEKRKNWDWDFGNKEYWNLNSEHLTPLVSFITDNIP